MKSLITWGKTRTYDINMIAPFIPIRYTTYVEPFAGSASLFFSLNNFSINSVLNDINEDLMNFYQQIKEGKGAEIKEFMDNHENNKETYYNILHNYCPNNPVEQASQFYYLRKTCHRSMLRYNKLGLFNVAFGNNETINCDALVDRAYKDALENTRIMNGDFGAVFEEYNGADNFIFIDPPDENESINSFTQDDHLRLFRYFTETDSKCLGIFRDTPFIKELYIDYIIAAYPLKGKNGTKFIVSNLA